MKQTTYTEFCAHYDRWLADALAEWNARYSDNRTLAEDRHDSIEFSEDGDAYPHGSGGIGHVRRAVTPWRDSPHYVE